MNINILNIFGLTLDMIGATLVAFEVVTQFRGEKFEAPPLQFGGTSKPIPTEKFKKWDIFRLFWMKLGLGFLICGSLLQIYANFLQLKSTSVLSENITCKQNNEVSSK
jgi:hypothetical protein